MFGLILLLTMAQC